MAVNIFQQTQVAAIIGEFSMSLFDLIARILLETALGIPFAPGKVRSALLKI